MALNFNHEQNCIYFCVNNSTGFFITDAMTGNFGGGGGGSSNGVLASNLNNSIVSANSIYAFIGAGSSNCIYGTSPYSFIGAGKNHCMNDACAAIILGGASNCVNSSNCSTVVGGTFNRIASSNFAFVGGGSSNCISQNSHYTFIGGGDSNFICQMCDSSIVGGSLNTICGDGSSLHSNILGGNNNKICASSFSSILGSLNNCILFSTGAHILGSGICANGAINTVYVNNICSSGGQYYGNGCGLTCLKGVFGNNVKVVGVDYPTIQQTIDSITDACFDNNYIVIIPPNTGRYWRENLILKGNVSLYGIAGGLSNSQSTVICGSHIFTGSSTAIGNNRLALDNLTFSNSGVLPTFCIYSTGVRNEVCFNNVYIQDSYTGLVSKNVVYASSGSVLYFNSSNVASVTVSNSTAICFALNFNSTLYLHCANAYIKNGSSIYAAANTAIKITGAGMATPNPYLEIRDSQIQSSGYISGAPVIRVDNGLTVIGTSSITNFSPTGNGIFIGGATTTVGSFGNAFSILSAGASTVGYYAIDGNGIYANANNMYSCIAALGLYYNNKYKSTITQQPYATTIVSQA